MSASGLEDVSKFSIYILFLLFKMQPGFRPDLQKSEAVLLHFLQLFIGIWPWGEHKTGHPGASGARGSVDQCDMAIPCPRAQGSWMEKAVKPTPRSEGRAVPTHHSNGIQCHLLMLCRAGPPSNTWDVTGQIYSMLGHAWAVGTCVCQPGPAAGRGDGGCVILLVLALPPQPQRTKVPHPAWGSMGCGSPRLQNRRCRAAHTCCAGPGPWARS